MPDADQGWARARITRQIDEELSLEPPPNWTYGALCSQVDTDIFFPEKGGTTKPAKQICRQCDVRETCLADALRRGERFGVWGGLSERERRKLEVAA